MKKILLGFMAAALLAGCGAETSEASTKESEQPTILYTGTVIDSGESYGNGIYLSSLIPVEADVASFDEVVLLMNEEIELVDHNTGDELEITELSAGDTIQVTLTEHVPTTMSLPPQIAGMGIIKVELMEQVKE
ncbi:hypothetical protein [Jeotgalibaca caeni]|uniref:hypothetical protein n=1 Tax=Jeotgalibaca caeni TaxID=3028623 RepID=UPI00237E3D00|nr:hypothetical protein [Jeotgalibaca caeni]MDE1549086.1 hypothetical protein [Jeotgalibaca caeni]